MPRTSLVVVSGTSSPRLDPLGSLALSQAAAVDCAAASSNVGYPAGVVLLSHPSPAAARRFRGTLSARWRHSCRSPSFGAEPYARSPRRAAAS